MDNVELLFEYNGIKYASILVDDEYVEIVKVLEKENKIYFEKITDDDLYSKLEEEYKTYDLEDGE